MKELEKSCPSWNRLELLLTGDHSQGIAKNWNLEVYDKLYVLVSSYVVVVLQRLSTLG